MDNSDNVREGDEVTIPEGLEVPEEENGEDNGDEEEEEDEENGEGETTPSQEFWI